MTDTSQAFSELLKDAPLAQDTDVVTVVGAISRTSDPERFVLTLADGRSETLDVKAVKSGKRLAGAVGQLWAQLELELKALPHALRDILILPFGGNKLPSADPHHSIPSFETVKEAFSDHGNDVAVPFVAAMPHHADVRKLQKPPHLDPGQPKTPTQDGTAPYHGGAPNIDITGGGFDEITWLNGNPTYSYR